MVQTTQHQTMIEKLLAFFQRLHDRKLNLTSEHVKIFDEGLSKFEEHLAEEQNPASASEAKTTEAETTTGTEAENGPEEIDNPKRVFGQQ